jgi:hypothetical protein
LTVHYRQGSEQLSIATSTTGAARVTNQLGAALRYLAVADESGEYYAAKNVAADASERLESLDLNDVHTALRALVSEQPLEIPPEITSRYYASGFFGRPRFWGARTAVQWQTGRSEEVLRGLQDTGVDKVKEMLKPRTYIAVTEQPPTLDLGVKQMKDEGSLHVVIGSY